MASKGKIHDVFRTNINDIVAQVGQQADAVRGPQKPPADPAEAPPDAGRPWNRPDKAPDPLDIAGITDAYDRTEIDAGYAELLKSGKDTGTCGDVISVKTQGDYIAIIERGFRARHATPVRCIGHAMARRKGHSKPNGVFQGGVVRHVQDALKAGQGNPVGDFPAENVDPGLV